MLSDLLELRLPRYPASPELKRRLAHLAAPTAAPMLAALALTAVTLMRSVARVRWVRVVAPALAAVLVVGVAVLVVERTGMREGGMFASMTSEAVNVAPGLEAAGNPDGGRGFPSCEEASAAVSEASLPVVEVGVFTVG